MSILFSPIGSADPVTNRGDGPMYHIVRYRHPSTIALLLSPKMAKYEKVYIESIEYLAKKLCCSLPKIEVIPSPEEKPHLFDVYIEEFEKHLKKLSRENPDEEILLNTTSGTPGMQSALVALGSLDRLYNLTMLQVEHPDKDMSKAGDRISIEDLCDPKKLKEALEKSEKIEWERREKDGAFDDPHYQGRIREVKTPNFSDRIIQECIKNLVRQFEYSAAYQLAESLSHIDDDTKEIIEAASQRLQLQTKLAETVFSKARLCNPSVVCRTNDMLVEHLYVMEVRLKQDHPMEFIMLMTPAFTEVMIELMKRKGIGPECYMQMVYDKRAKKKRPGRQYDSDKIKKDDRLRKAFKLRPGGKPSWVTNNHYVNLIKEFYGNEGEDGEIKKKVEDLRTMEDECRNELAHNIKRSDRNYLENKGGMNFEEVIETLRYLHDIVYPNTKMKPGLYVCINAIIIEKLLSSTSSSPSK